MEVLRVPKLAGWLMRSDSRAGRIIGALARSPASEPPPPMRFLGRWHIGVAANSTPGRIIGALSRVQSRPASSELLKVFKENKETAVKLPDLSRHSSPPTSPRRSSPATSSGPHDVRFLTVAEAATIMRVSKMSVYRLVHSGELEAIRVGRSFRIPEQAVNLYLRESSPPTSPRRSSPATSSGPHDVRFLTVAEAATVMRVSKMSVYRLVHSGELEAIRVGRSFRIPEQAVNRYLNEANTDVSYPYRPS